MCGLSLFVLQLGGKVGKQLSVEEKCLLIFLLIAIVKQNLIMLICTSVDELSSIPLT